MVSWEVVRHQDVKWYSVMGLGQDSLVLCLHNLCAQDPFASRRRPEHFWSLPTPTEHLSRRDPTVHAIRRSSSTLASLAKQFNKLLQSVIVLLPFVREHFSSDHDLALNCSRVFCRVKSIPTCTRFQILLSHHTNQRIMPGTDTNTPLLLPSPTTHRLILLRQAWHRHCEGLSLGTRARTAG